MSDSVEVSGGPRTLDDGAATEVPGGDFESLLRKAAETPTYDLTPLALQPGDPIGRFVVRAKIGKGGMGVVYRAEDPELERAVAIKLHLGFGHTDATLRLQREAKVMAQFTHPNVLTVYEVGTHQGHVFIAMEYAEGGSLKAWLEAEPRPYRDILAMFIAAGHGVAAAHDVGLVHRDFKADNVLLDANGRARVADFGLARTADDVERPAEGRDEITLSSPSGRLTAAGAAMGTPSYMPPEQYGAGQATAAADQFAFCASLYEALYGQPPFAGETMAERFAQILEGNVREPAPGPVPRRIWKILRQGLSSDPGARHPDMRRLLASLAYDPRVRVRRWAVGVGLAGLVATGVWMSRREPVDPCEGAGEAIGQTWDAARKQPVADALASAPEGQDSVARLDAFADEWATARRDVCEASRVRGEQSEAMYDLRMACLDRQLAVFDGTVRTLESGDEQVVARSEDVVAGLPSLHACDDKQALLDGEPPPPERIRAQVTEQWSRLGELDALSKALLLEKARALADVIFDDVEAIDYPPLQTEAVYARGKILERLGEYDAAIADLDRAMTGAVELGDASLLSRAAGRLAFILGVRKDQPAEAIRLLAIARAAATRADAGQLGTIEGIASTLYRATGDHAAAAAAAKRALELAEDNKRDEPGGAWSERYQYAVTLDEAGRPEEAGPQFRQAIADLESAFGSDDARLLMPLRGAGIHFGQRGDREESRQLFERRIDLARRSLGEKSEGYLDALQDVAWVRAADGDDVGALEAIDEALRIYDSLPERHVPELVQLLGTRGQVLTTLHRCTEALAAFEQARSQLREAGKVPKLTTSSHRMAEVACLADERPLQAWSAVGRMLELADKDFSPDSLSMVQMYAVASNAANAVEKWDESLKMVARGLEIVAMHDGVSVQNVGDLYRHQARAFVGLGRTAEAATAYAASIEAFWRERDHHAQIVDRVFHTAAELARRMPDRTEDAAAAIDRVASFVEGRDEDWARQLRASIASWRAEHPGQAAGPRSHGGG